MINPRIALIPNIDQEVNSDPKLEDNSIAIQEERPLLSIPNPSTRPPPNISTIFQSTALVISSHVNNCVFRLGRIRPIDKIINRAGTDSGIFFIKTPTRPE